VFLKPTQRKASLRLHTFHKYHYTDNYAKLETKFCNPFKIHKQAIKNTSVSNYFGNLPKNKIKYQDFRNHLGKNCVETITSKLFIFLKEMILVIIGVQQMVRYNMHRSSCMWINLYRKFTQVWKTLGTHH